MSIARYHDELAVLMSRYQGQTFTAKRIRELFQRAYPHLDIEWVSPSDHCVDHKPKGACPCAKTDRAIFSRPEYNTYIVRAPSTGSQTRSQTQNRVAQPKLFLEPVTAPRAADRAVANAILEFGKRIDPQELFPVLLSEAADLALGDPYAFALATCLDRGTKADIIWTIPYYIRENLGHLDPGRILRLSIADLRDLYYRLPHRPRYVNDAPRTTQELTRMVVYRFEGDASLMWKGKTAAEVKRTFRNIYGVGEQISNMAVLLIEKAFGIHFGDLERPSIDIKADVHTMRVLHRLGVSATQSETSAIKAARHLHPAYPGELDAPLWIVGRKWCHYVSPRCHECVLETVCKKVGVTT